MAAEPKQSTQPQEVVESHIVGGDITVESMTTFLETLYAPATVSDVSLYETKGHPRAQWVGKTVKGNVPRTPAIRQRRQGGSDVTVRFLLVLVFWLGHLGCSLATQVVPTVVTGQPLT